MKKLLLLLTLTISFASCIKNNVISQSSPHIKSFGFSTHDSIPGLDKIHFTVDTFKCLVYNEDSIVYGAKLSKIKPNILYTGNPHKIKVNGVDWNKNDSIDFTNPIQYYIQSQNKKHEATYTITLNQHKVDPDELKWTQQKAIALPSPAQIIRCVNTNESIYLFIQESNGTSMYTSTDASEWTRICQFENPILLPSIEVYNNQIFALGADSTTLLKLTQNTWETASTFTSGKMADILGSINQQLYILYKANGNQLARYSGTNIEPEASSVLPAQFGIEGYAKLNINNTIYLIGGKLNEQVQNCVISSDNGHYWTNILNQTGMHTFPPRSNSAAAYYGNFIFLFGGYNENMLVEHTHYLSNNGGYSWNTLRKNQLLPNNYHFNRGTQAITFKNNLLLISIEENNKTLIAVWKGRIRKIDFIQQPA